MSEVIFYGIKYFVKTGFVKSRNNYIFSEYDLVIMKIIEDLSRFHIDTISVQGIIKQLETYKIESIKNIYISTDYQTFVETDEYKFKINQLEPYIVINVRKILDKIYSLKGNK